MSSDEGLPKKERLIKTKDFRIVYRQGRSFKAGAFIFKTSANALPANRIGFSISARTIKSSCRRNTIRRLFREAYRKNKNFLKQGFDLVLIVKKDPGKTFSYSEAKDMFLKAAKAMGIFA